MEEAPLEQPRSGLPKPLPTISKRQLWSCLLLPTVCTVAAFLLQWGALATELIKSDTVFVVLAYNTWFIGSIMALFCVPWFVILLKQRYRGKSLVLLSLGYAFGQVVIQFPLGYGGCFLAIILSDPEL